MLRGHGLPAPVRDGDGRTQPRARRKAEYPPAAVVHERWRIPNDGGWESAEILVHEKFESRKSRTAVKVVWGESGKVGGMRAVAGGKPWWMSERERRAESSGGGRGCTEGSGRAHAGGTSDAKSSR